MTTSCQPTTGFIKRIVWINYERKPLKYFSNGRLIFGSFFETKKLKKEIYLNEK